MEITKQNQTFNLKDTKPATEKEATIVIKKPKINFE